MKRLGAAIIGCGSIHGVHADAIVSSELSRLVSVVDIDEKRARASASKYNCRWYVDYRDVLSDDQVDVVHICTPHYLHASMAIEAVRSGKHVLVEKPVAISVSQAQEMAEESKKHGRYIGVCFQNRFNPESQKAKEVIDSGTIGQVKGVKGIVTWFRTREYYTESGWRGRFATEGGGVLINQAIHTLDLMQWLGGGVKAVKGNVATNLLGDVIEVEDTADALLFFKNGARGIFYATNCYVANSPVEIEIVCEKATLRIYDGTLVMEQGGSYQRLVSKGSGETAYKSYWGRSHAILIEEFYKAILSGNPRHIISVEEGMESLKIIDGIYKSSSTGNVININ
ncbi:putative dehydrogenase [Caldicoprobacter guelmensis]|uniref:Gfo/Idh/MocA family protein n=1 Tax=Caldicoprobacter guelmensis TaxID=1170224 RepID=UPI00195BC218|nr:Gfo/Idh/MocA family oxidoreductase [Caldicoprobacter guelmensis]MBM7581178.1 putative dehydrogenase [Caldicoprobacter guelmensis]